MSMEQCGPTCDVSSRTTGYFHRVEKTHLATTSGKRRVFTIIAAGEPNPVIMNHHQLVLSPLAVDFPQGNEDGTEEEEENTYRSDSG